MYYRHLRGDTLILNLCLLFFCFSLAVVSSFLFLFIYLKHHILILKKSCLLYCVVNAFLVIDFIKILFKISNANYETMELVTFYMNLPLFSLLFYCLIQFCMASLYKTVSKTANLVSWIVSVLPVFLYIFLFQHSTTIRYTPFFKMVLIIILISLLIMNIRVVLKLKNRIKKILLFIFIILNMLSIIIIVFSLIFIKDYPLQSTGNLEYIIYMLFNSINIVLLISYFGKNVSVKQRLAACMYNFDFSKLTDKEKKIVNLIQKGLINRDIANELKISENTVKAHIYNIFNKLHIKNRTELIIKFQSETSSLKK